MEPQMKTRTVIISAAIIALLGAGAAVYAQGHRHHRHGPGPMDGPFGEHGMDRHGGFGGFHGRFGRSLTKDDYDARARERFARLDKNGDGVLDAAEIEAEMTSRREGWRRLRGSDGPQPANRLIHLFDDNKDGKVSKEEHAAGIRRLFAELDLDNDGRITDADLPPVMRGRNVIARLGESTDAAPGMGRRMGGGRGLPMLALLRGADQNKDGAVTLEEALAVGAQRFASLDRNSDGAIDRADFDALRKEMTDYRIKRFIHHYGGDKDGRVTRDQFMAKWQERVARLDRDNDGTLSAGELPWRGRGHGGPWGHGRHMGPDGGGEPGGPRRGEPQRQ
jgi:Ca2+-binding EF-hand superfamily protein